MDIKRLRDAPRAKALFMLSSLPETRHFVVVAATVDAT